MKATAVWIAAVVGGLVVTAAAADRLKVTVYDAPVRATKSPLGKVVATLDLGDDVEAEKVAGAEGWYAISQGPAGPLKGFLSAESVAPAGKTGTTGAALRKGADDPAVAASVKGWDENHRGNPASAGWDYAAVEWMERVGGARRRELDAPTGPFADFRRAGGLGEFSVWGLRESAAGAGDAPTGAPVPPPPPPPPPATN